MAIRPTWWVAACATFFGADAGDFDVATDATPAEIRDLFRNCRIIGRRFRPAHIVFGRKIIETATFRANPRPPAAESGLPAKPGPRTGDDDEAAEGPGGALARTGDSDVYLYRDNVFGTAEEDAAAATYDQWPVLRSERAGDRPRRWA